MQVQFDNSCNFSIQDNGHGIRREDYELLCTRFCTSKLTSFEDLFSKEFSSYGFRGEALASISQISGRLLVRSKHLASPVAYSAEFVEGKLVPSSVKASAGLQGTMISVQGLFAQDPLRKNKLKSSNEEYSSITQMLGYYSIECAGRVSITFRKQDAKNIGAKNASLSYRSYASKLDAISGLFSQDLVTNLVPLEFEDADLSISAAGYTSQASFHGQKSTVFILFINGRLVESQSIKSAIVSYYSGLLLKKSYSWTFLSLRIPSNCIDVNVHPTKSTVVLMNEDKILDLIVRSLEMCLQANSQSVMTLASQETRLVNDIGRPLMPTSTKPSALMGRSIGTHGSKSIPAFSNVRTDPYSQSLETCLAADAMDVAKRSRQDAAPLLSSIVKMRQQLVKDCDDALSEMLKNHSYVGVFLVETSVDSGDPQRPPEVQVLFQYSTGLYGWDILPYLGSMIYQYLLSTFGMNQTFSPNDTAVYHLDKHCKVDMLREYFGISFVSVGDDGRCKIEKLPMVFGLTLLSVDDNAELVDRLCSNTEWSEEAQCFADIFSHLTIMYGRRIKRLLLGSMSQDAGDGNEADEFCRTLLFPIIKTMPYFPPVSLRDGTPSGNHASSNGCLEKSQPARLLKLADLKDLYKVFERC